MLRATFELTNPPIPVREKCYALSLSYWDLVREVTLFRFCQGSVHSPVPRMSCVTSLMYDPLLYVHTWFLILRKDVHWLQEHLWEVGFGFWDCLTLLRIRSVTCRERSGRKNLQELQRNSQILRNHSIFLRNHIWCGQLFDSLIVWLVKASDLGSPKFVLPALVPVSAYKLCEKMEITCFMSTSWFFARYTIWIHRSRA